MHTHITAPTRFVEADGVRFAYRRLGADTGIPLVFLQHFSGHMDSWDPMVVDGLAAHRPVILFDNAGVGQSGGRTPDNVADMAAAAAGCLAALGVRTADLLGYSLGGFIAQTLAADRPNLVRRLILVGTAPQGGEEHLMAVLAEAMSHTEAPDPRLPLFFTPSPASQAAGLAFLSRAAARTEDRDPDSSDAVMNPQANALIAWCAGDPDDDAMLKKIHQPVVLVSGSNDTMLPADNAYRMFKTLADARLVLYPDSDHGVLFQYQNDFVSQMGLFLPA